jgi:HK97 gp10 family phage protein
MKLEGLKEMQRALKKLPDNIQWHVVIEALLDAGEPMRDEAAMLAPDATPLGVGLSKSLVVSEKATGGELDRKDEATVYVGPKTDRPNSGSHGLVVELGSGPRYHESGKFVGQMPPAPFLRPAFDATKVAVLRRFASKLKVIIETEARQLSND